MLRIKSISVIDRKIPWASQCNWPALAQPAAIITVGHACGLNSDNGRKAAETERDRSSVAIALVSCRLLGGAREGRGKSAFTCLR